LTRSPAPARPSVLRRGGALSIAQHRARRLCWPYAPYPCEGAAARRPRADHPAVFPRRVTEPFRRLRSELLMRTAKNAGWLAGRFDFVLEEALQENAPSRRNA